MNLLDKTELERLRVTVDAYQYYIGEDLTNGISVIARYAKAFLEIAPMLIEQVDKNGLEPCPFCGGEAHDYKKIVWNGETVPEIGCADCGARSPIFGDNSAKAWNTRVDNTAKAVEKLKGE